MLKETDFVWYRHMENNIESNPLQEYYCIIDTDNGSVARKYSIVPQYPSSDDLCINLNTEPEYFILFEALGHKATEEEKRKIFYKYQHFDDYIFNDMLFIRVFTNINDAKKRAYRNYAAIYNYALSYIVEDIEKETKKHFCATKMNN